MDGTREVTLLKTKLGFGFSLTGQNPCALACISKGGSAEKAGLNVGDFLLGINGYDVTNASHDDVVALIGNSRHLLSLVVKSDYYQSAPYMASVSSHQVQSELGSNAARFVPASQCVAEHLGSCALPSILVQRLFHVDSNNQEGEFSALFDRECDTHVTKVRHSLRRTLATRLSVGRSVSLRISITLVEQRYYLQLANADVVVARHALDRAVIGAFDFSDAPSCFMLVTRDLQPRGVDANANRDFAGDCASETDSTIESVTMLVFQKSNSAESSSLLSTLNSTLDFCAPQRCTVLRRFCELFNNLRVSGIHVVENSTIAAIPDMAFKIPVAPVRTQLQTFPNVARTNVVPARTAPHPFGQFTSPSSTLQEGQQGRYRSTPSTSSSSSSDDTQGAGDTWQRQPVPDRYTTPAVSNTNAASSSRFATVNSWRPTTDYAYATQTLPSRSKANSTANAKDPMFTSSRFNDSVANGESTDAAAGKRQRGTSNSEDKSSKQNEAVAKWATDFNALLSDPAGRKTFENFLQTEHSDENMHFYEQILQFKALRNEQQRAKKAREIYACFFSPDAREPVNVDCSVSNDLHRTLADRNASIDATLFDAAQREIVKLMRLDSYSRFITSDAYRAALVNGVGVGVGVGVSAIASVGVTPPATGKRSTGSKSATTTSKTDPKGVKKRDAGRRDGSTEIPHSSFSWWKPRSPNKNSASSHNSSIGRAHSSISLSTTTRIDQGTAGSCDQLARAGIDEPNATKKKPTLIGWFRNRAGSKRYKDRPASANVPVANATLRRGLNADPAHALAPVSTEFDPHTVYADSNAFSNLAIAPQSTSLAARNFANNDYRQIATVGGSAKSHSLADLYSASTSTSTDSQEDSPRFADRFRHQATSDAQATEPATSNSRSYVTLSSAESPYARSGSFNGSSNSTTQSASIADVSDDQMSIFAGYQYATDAVHVDFSGVAYTCVLRPVLSSAQLDTEREPTISSMVERLCRLQNVRPSSVEVLHANSDRLVGDLKRPLRGLVNKQIMIDKRALIRADLPNGRCVLIKAKLQKTVRGMLKPVAEKYNFSLSALVVLVKQSNDDARVIAMQQSVQSLSSVSDTSSWKSNGGYSAVHLDTSVALLDGCHVKVILNDGSDHEDSDGLSNANPAQPSDGPIHGSSQVGNSNQAAAQNVHGDNVKPNPTTNPNHISPLRFNTASSYLALSDRLPTSPPSALNPSAHESQVSAGRRVVVNL